MDGLKQDIAYFIEQLKDRASISSAADRSYRIIRQYDRLGCHLERDGARDKETEDLYMDWIVAFNERYSNELDRAIFRANVDVPVTEAMIDSAERLQSDIFKLLPCFPEYDAAYAAEFRRNMADRWDGF